ncbi:MAG: glycosyltransferase family 4 protein [Acidobacteriaceae bacterium]
MKIAFVSQPIDTIIPPYQNSVGACTYSVAKLLAQSNDVVVYGLTDIHENLPQAEDTGIDYRFFPATRSDKRLHVMQRQLAKFFRRSTPISTSRWWYPGYGRQVAEDLSKQGCDVIHLQHCSQYAPVIRAFNPKAKIVLHLHAEWFSQSNPAVLANRLDSVDLVTTVGDYVTDKIKRTFPVVAGRCETTYNGIDAQEFARDKDYTASQQRMKRILYSGAVSPHKGLHVLLEAFVPVARQYPDVQLDIVGPIGNYPLEENFDLRDQKQTIRALAPFYAMNPWSAIRSKLLRKATDRERYLRYLKASLPADVAERVSFLGMIPRSELVDRYYAADIFAFAPIWNEGFGLPPVEAMAAGLPVVTSRSGTVMETVVDGKTGYLVEKNNAAELAEALLALLKDDARREAMGRAGRRRALGYFSWNAIAEGMHARYQSLCKLA